MTDEIIVEGAVAPEVAPVETTEAAPIATPEVVEEAPEAEVAAEAEVVAAPEVSA